MEKNKILKCLLIFLCFLRIILPKVIYADDPADVTQPVSVYVSNGTSEEMMYGDVTVTNDPASETTHYGHVVNGDAIGEGSKVIITTEDVALNNNAKEAKIYQGIDASATDGATTIINAGNVTVENINGTGVSISGVELDADFGASTVTVETGNILVNGEAETQIGLNIDAMSFDGKYADDVTDIDQLKGNPSVATATVGEIEVANGTGVDIDSTLKAIATATTEDITAKDGADIRARYGGEANLIVNGDISAVEEGLKINADSRSKVDVFIDGTLSAQTPIVLGANVTAENTTITLREIQKNPAETQDLLRGTVSDDDPRIAEIVNYIIDIEQDSDVLNLLNSDGQPLNRLHDKDVAKQGEQVVLNIIEGYRIINAYCNDQLLEKDSEGRYIIEVPFGGKIQLRADFETDGSKDGGGSDDVSPAPASNESIVVRFVPPTTGIGDSHHFNTVKLCMALLDGLIISLFFTSFNTRANRKQFYNSLPDYLK